MTSMATELDPNESDAIVLWTEIARLRSAIRGPDGYASWQDAAVAERVRRVRAEAALSAQAEPQAAAEPVRFTDTTGTLERARACTEIGHIFSVDAASGIRFCDNCGLGEVAARKVDRLQPAPAPAQPEKVAVEQQLAAPANSLPDWEECQLRVHNSNFIAKRVAEGGYGAEQDSKLATQLHRFIYEYDDAEPYRSAWFLHRLELVLNEVRESAQPQLSEADLRTIVAKYGNSAHPCEENNFTTGDWPLVMAVRAAMQKGGAV